jgi:hypothetical protein
MNEETKNLTGSTRDEKSIELSEQDLDNVAGGFKFVMLPMDPPPPLKPDNSVPDPPLAPIKIGKS